MCIRDRGIGCTVTDPVTQEVLPMLRIDEPTLTMNFICLLYTSRCV